MARIAEQQYEVVPVGRLQPHPKNPRQGDVGAIAESIDTNGFYGVVVAQKGSGVILAGKHRWEAAVENGLDEVPVVWLDVDDERALRIVLADNRTADLAAYDEPLLAELLADLANNGGDLDGTGWSGDDLDALLYDLGASGGDIGSTNEGLTPADRAAAWEASSIRSLLLPVPAGDYESLLADLALLRADLGVESNAAVVVTLIRERVKSR